MASADVRVKVYPIRYQKNGTTYQTWAVKYTECGQRKLIKRASREEAEAVAERVAANKEAQRGTFTLDGFRSEIRHALEAVHPTGISILPACQLFAQAVKILGGAEDLLSACQYWCQHRPNDPTTPKLINEAIHDYLARQNKISPRRRRAMTCYLTTFAATFGARPLHEVSQTELRDLVDSRKWAAKTRTEFLNGISLLYKEGQFRHWVPVDCNPTRGIKRSQVRGTTVHVFEPWEAVQLLSRADDELIPFLTIWLFAGVRKEEISRLSWQEVNRGLESGWLYLEANQTKTGEPRSVPLAENLKLWLRDWLARYPRVSGSVLPAKWNTMQQLDGMTRHLSRKTGVVWRNNAPRHSFASYSFKLSKDAGEVVKAMGTSLEKFQRFYWCKANTITEDAARAWLAIVPPQPSNLVRMPKAETVGAAPSGNATVVDQATAAGTR